MAACLTVPGCAGINVKAQHPSSSIAVPRATTNGVPRRIFDSPLFFFISQHKKMGRRVAILLFVADAARTLGSATAFLAPTDCTRSPRPYPSAVRPASAASTGTLRLRRGAEAHTRVRAKRDERNDSLGDFPAYNKVRWTLAARSLNALALARSHASARYSPSLSCARSLDSSRSRSQSRARTRAHALSLSLSFSLSSSAPVPPGTI